MDITPADLIAEARRLAKERPHFNYKGQSKTLGTTTGNCSYLGVSQLTPYEGEGCIFGQALTNLGVSRERLFQLEGSRIPSALRKYSGLPPHPRHGYTREEEWMRDVQMHQDTGRSWGEAVELTDQHHATLPE